MKSGFYMKLAASGMRKNRKLYTPYLLTGIMMSAVLYIISFLSRSKSLEDMPGHESLSMILSMGIIVIAVFALIFLFYTNSFLVKRRMKEYGLYNMLGMGKRNISRLILCETLITYLVTVAGGIVLGILLSKLGEMLVLNLVGGIVKDEFTIPAISIIGDIVCFAVIYLLVFLNSLRIVRKANAVELLKSENLDEKPPKSNWVLGIIGLILLGGAYYLAIAIKEPLEAIIFFMIAVVMVIIATYMLFIAGSVILCRLLQKDKDYYYNKKHFTSVGQMVFRMKRNGAGLASICILMTMVLVTISSTASLYIGKEACMQSRYPKDLNIRWMQYGYDADASATAAQFTSDVESTIARDNIKSQNNRHYTEYAITGYLDKSFVDISLNSESNLAFIDYNKICEVKIIDIADYNRMFGQNVQLAQGEAIIYAVRTDDYGDKFRVGDLTFKVKDVLKKGSIDLFGTSEAAVCSTIFVFTPNAVNVAEGLKSYTDVDGTPMICHCWYYEFDFVDEYTDSEMKVIESDLQQTMAKYDHWNLSCDSKQLKRSDFYGTFGGLLFLGGMLSLLFLVAAVLIIYYKQVSEGYEDKSRFEIMQKVGMTNEDIKKSIDSQMLTLFLAPIIMATIHLCFAFPFINKILMLFGLLDLKLLILVTAGCVLVFSLIYALAYKWTSNAYYKLVAL